MFSVMVVDDDKSIRYVIKELLEYEHYTVYTAANGKEALDILWENHIDLVIVDIMMPEIDGYEFTKEVRSVNKELPILMVSAKQMPEDRIKGFISGIDDYMSKPISNEELLLHIKALLRRVDSSSAQKIVIGNVTLDYKSFTVTRGDEVYKLPQKEFQLLFRLLSSPDKIFTRLQLMEEIWGYSCETGSDTVTVHISRLRKKFEGWEEFEIKSIIGLGYKAVKKV